MLTAKKKKFICPVLFHYINKYWVQCRFKKRQGFDGPDAHFLLQAKQLEENVALLVHSQHFFTNKFFCNSLALLGYLFLVCLCFVSLVV